MIDPILLLHRYSSQGDVTAIQHLFDTYPSLDVNATLSSSLSSTTTTNDDDTDMMITKKRKDRYNTSLHYAVSYNQKNTKVIEYLLSIGANPNIGNKAGYTPFMLAIVNGHTIVTIQTLLEYGANEQLYHTTSYDTIMFYASKQPQHHRNELEQLFERYRKNQMMDHLPQQHHMKNDNTIENIENDTSQNNYDINRRKRNCPICHCSVKFPSRMSFLRQYRHDEQRCDEKDADKCQDYLPPSESVSSDRRHIDSSSSSSSKDHYLHHFLSSKAFTEMCQIEYHGVNNMHHLCKEISESWSIISSMRRHSIIHDDDHHDMKDTMIIDLCSGKCFTTILLRILYPMGTYLAIDKLPSHVIPQCSGLRHNDDDNDVVDQWQQQQPKKSSWYWCRDIMDQQLLHDLNHRIQQFLINDGTTIERRDQGGDGNNDDLVTLPEHNNKTIVLVGMHLCGNLSHRAIELFETIPSIKYILLCPCCLPKKSHKEEKKKKSKSQQQLSSCKQQPQQQLSDDNKNNHHVDPSQNWVNHLQSKIENSISDVTYCQVYQDDQMNTDKNSIIIASRDKK